MSRLIDELAPRWVREPPVLAVPTKEREFWRVWGSLSGPGRVLSPAEADLRRRMGPLVSEKLRPKRRRRR